MKITTCIAHGTDVIHRHVAILHPTARKQLPQFAASLYTANSAYLLCYKVVQVKLAGFKPKFFRLLVARMTHYHVEQYPAYRIFADYTVSFARKPTLTMIAQSFPAHFVGRSSKVYATTWLLRKSLPWIYSEPLREV
jgi:hypothetical protein